MMAQRALYLEVFLPALSIMRASRGQTVCASLRHSQECCDLSRSELPKWLLSAGSKSTSSPRNRSRLARQEQQISAAADPVPWREIVDVEFEIIRAAKRQAIAGQRILDVAHA